MPVSEYPARLTGTVTYSSFVLLTLDIAASVRGVTDEKAIRAAEALPRAKCLAWIYQPVSKLGSRLPHFTFFLAGRGLPAPPHSFAAVPIAPNTPHPETGRAAVQPSHPFPWRDCFIHTLDKRTLPISRLYEPPDSGIALDDTQRGAFLRAWYDDMDATAEEQLAIAIAAGIAIPADAHNVNTGSSRTSSAGSDSASGSDSTSSRDDEPTRSNESSASRQSSNCSTPSDRSSSALAARLAEHDPGPGVEDQEIVLHVQVSGILDPTLDFGTVDEFLAVRDRLAEIEEDRAERAAIAHLARAAAPKTAAWLQGISAAGGIEDAVPGDETDYSTPQGEPSLPRPLASCRESSGELVSIPQAVEEQHSRTHRSSDASNKENSGSDRSTPTPLSPSAPAVSPSTDVSARPLNARQPIEASRSSPSPSSNPYMRAQPPAPQANTAAEAASGCGRDEVIPSKSLPGLDPPGPCATTIISDYPARLTGTVKNGSFVILTLDIAASIRGVTDETAIREAEALPRAKCLAWIYLPSSSLGSRLPHWTFFLAGRRLPAAPHSFAAVPIAPNTPHPETGRAAVEPSCPFPWPDCFMHTLDDLTAPISRLYGSSEPSIALDTSQRRSFLRAWYADMDATADEQLAIAIADGIAIPMPLDTHGGDSDSSGSVSVRYPASRSVCSSLGDTGDESSEKGLASQETSDCSTLSDRSSSARGALAAHIAEHDLEPVLEDRGIVLHVQVSGILDPSIAFGTVEEFLAVHDRLAEIEGDRAERAVTAHLARAAVPKTAAWLKGMAIAGDLYGATLDHGEPFDVVS